MDNRYTIRSATPDDYADICQILAENGFDETVEAESFLKAKVNPELFIVQERNNTVGLIIYEPVNENTVQIDWYLKEKFSHKNLGTYLTRTMSEEVLNKGLDCQFTVSTGNPAKLSIVRKLGFTRVTGSLKQAVYLKKRPDRTT